MSLFGGSQVTDVLSPGECGCLPGQATDSRMFHREGVSTAGEVVLVVVGVARGYLVFPPYTFAAVASTSTPGWHRWSSPIHPPVVQPHPLELHIHWKPKHWLLKQVLSPLDANPTEVCLWQSAHAYLYIDLLEFLIWHVLYRLLYVQQGKQLAIPKEDYCMK